MPDITTGDPATNGRRQPKIDMSDSNRLLTINEFCAWAQVTPRTYRGWCQNGTAPKRIKIGGRHIRIRVADAIAWAESRYVD